jgi:hypothetical protein
MRVAPTLSGGSGQSPKRVSIGGQLLVHWLQGNLQIGPPSKRKRESSNGSRRHAVNGNGAATRSDDDVKYFIVEVGVERVQRNLDELKRPALPPQATVSVS